MTTTQLALQISLFGLALWLGLYLIARDVGSLRLWLAGLGLVTYAIGLALDILSLYARSGERSLTLLIWQRLFVFFPAAFWISLLAYLIPGEQALHERLQQHPRPTAVLLIATLFFMLGITFLLFPFSWLPRTLVLLGIGCDLLLLGVVIAVMDAFDQGEALLPHFLRSLDYAFFTTLLFGGQVVLVMAYGIGVTYSLLLLLLTTIAAAVLLQTFADPFHAFFDRVAFFNTPRLRQERSHLRAQSDALTRADDTLQLDKLDSDTFTRYTRQALSQMGNLPHLARSPLTRLPLVVHRLQQNGQPTDTLTRAGELRLVLTESIERLKPPGEVAFGTTDEWRHYNALHFPYVRGLKPYSRRLVPGEEETAVLPILDWFRTQVPQRTLYNWQNAAAALVARDLRERSRRVGVNGR
ncbi:MAG: hypothetical protein KDE56_19445 [Anaerolineales bacterium]|nr:hypothetical protein [Anaerolineales bacterium]